jgi:hypothetical protein
VVVDVRSTSTIGEGLADNRHFANWICNESCDTVPAVLDRCDAFPMRDEIR